SRNLSPPQRLRGSVHTGRSRIRIPRGAHQAFAAGAGGGVWLTRGHIVDPICAKIDCIARTPTHTHRKGFSLESELEWNGRKARGAASTVSTAPAEKSDHADRASLRTWLPAGAFILRANRTQR